MNNLRLLFTTTALAVMTNTLAQAQKTCQQTVTEINVAADQLGKALLAFSEQTGCQVTFDRKSVQQFHSNKVKGNLIPSDALIALVKGTGLEVHAEQNNLSINQDDQFAISSKANDIQKKLKLAVNKHAVSKSVADQKINDLETVKHSVVDLAKTQGFISAAEKASYNRTFKEIQELVGSSK